MKDPIREAVDADLSVLDAEVQPVAEKDVEALIRDFKALNDRFYGRYKLGVITALPKELAAVTRVFDEPPQRLYHHLSEVEYHSIEIDCTGGQGKHRIILTLCPSMGNSSSAIAATAMLKDFPAIKEVVMVGIAGGIPRLNSLEKDVWLGDIVVSKGSGLVQYDLTKIEDDRILVRSEAPKPSSRLARVADLLEADRVSNGSQPWLAFLPLSTRIENGLRPSQDKDGNLKARTYDVTADPRRKSDAPVVHFGIIASANVLLKNSELRDELRAKFDVKAAEMEASGIADAAWFEGKGYLIIRGICDYCDKQKGDEWQGYAAAAAAAYLRALLERLPGVT